MIDPQAASAIALIALTAGIFIGAVIASSGEYKRSANDRAMNREQSRRLAAILAIKLKPRSNGTAHRMQRIARGEQA